VSFLGAPLCDQLRGMARDADRLDALLRAGVNANEQFGAAEVRQWATDVLSQPQ
jgi:hypothetical protein